MKLIIDIPDHVYEWVKNTGKFGMYRFDTAKVIQNGIPLDAVKAEIDTDLSVDMFDEYGNETRLRKDLMDILGNIGKADMRKSKITCGYTDKEIAEDFIKSVEAVKDLLPERNCKDCPYHELKDIKNMIYGCSRWKCIEDEGVSE